MRARRIRLRSMARYKPQPDPFRCRAMMPDGSVTVLFASTSGTASSAVQLVRASFATDEIQPVKVIVYRGGKSRPIVQPVLEWTRA